MKEFSIYLYFQLFSLNLIFNFFNTQKNQFGY